MIRRRRQRPPLCAEARLDRVLALLVGGCALAYLWRIILFLANQP